MTAHDRAKRSQKRASVTVSALVMPSTPSTLSTLVTPSTPVTPSTRAKTVPRTEGQRLLQAMPASGAALARSIGCSRAAVHAWRTGLKTPGCDTRRRIQAELGVDARAWSYRAGWKVPR